jgi:hypothetical protein
MADELKGKIDTALKELLPHIADAGFRGWAQRWLESAEGVDAWGAYRSACEHGLPCEAQLLTHAAQNCYDGQQNWIVQKKDFCAVAERELEQAVALQKGVRK